MAVLDEAPPLPGQALAPERTFYFASLSKNVATGLRFGFLFAPGTHEEQIVRSLRRSTWGVSGLITALATGWIVNSTTPPTPRRSSAGCASHPIFGRTKPRRTSPTSASSSRPPMHSPRPITGRTLSDSPSRRRRSISSPTFSNGSAGQSIRCLDDECRVGGVRHRAEDQPVIDRLDGPKHRKETTT